MAANYREASRARSAAEFVAKIELCASEADESQLWLELLRDDCGINADLINPLWQEAAELIAILSQWPKMPKSNKCCSDSALRSRVSAILRVQLIP